MTKIDSLADYLIVGGAMLIMFGNWNELKTRYGKPIAIWKAASTADRLNAIGLVVAFLGAAILGYHR